jgi:hypothetical protein
MIPSRQTQNECPKQSQEIKNSRVNPHFEFNSFPNMDEEIKLNDQMHNNLQNEGNLNLGGHHYIGQGNPFMYPMMGTQFPQYMGQYSIMPQMAQPVQQYLIPVIPQYLPMGPQIRQMDREGGQEMGHSPMVGNPTIISQPQPY